MSNCWLYDVLQAFNENHYKDLLQPQHVVERRFPIRVEGEHKPFTVLVKDGIHYAIEDKHFDELPIIVNKSFSHKFGRKYYEMITSFSSARFREAKIFSFRKLVNDLCDFEHSSKKDFVLWKIVALASVIGRTAVRVSSQPSFGKDSVIKVLGDLLGDVIVVSNPTVAKLEYRIEGNKLLMLNEMANLSGEERRSMEHFLLATGDLSNVYEKHSRASHMTKETYNISNLSLLIAYNNKDCYPEDSKYFDNIFQWATRSRFLPLKFSGQITEKLGRLPEAVAVAEENADYYRNFIRSLMWYRNHWFEELEEIDYDTKSGADYDLDDRWRMNFDTIRHFILLYAQSHEEAQALVSLLYNCHLDYVLMERGGTMTLGESHHPREEIRYVEEAFGYE